MQRTTGTAVPAAAGAAVLALGLAAAGAAASDWPGWSGVRAGFGAAVAVIGDDVLVGEASPAGAPGTVFVYRRSADGWTEQAKLQASDKPADGFGAALAADGTTLLVSAVDQSMPLGSSVHVFERTADGSYRRTGRLQPQDTAALSLFAYSISLDGNTALVGAPLFGAAENDPQSATGGVFAFERSAGGAWTSSGPIVPAAAQPGSVFGVTVAVGGARALTASPVAGVVALRRGSNGWTEVGKVEIAGVEQADQLGAALLIDGDAAYIGAPNRNGGAGAVFTLAPAGDGWTVTGTIDAPEGAQRFGASLALADGRLSVGAPATAENLGAVYVFERQGDAWRQTGAVTPDGGAAGDAFGGALAAGGGRIVVGSVRALYGIGAAAIFEGAAGSWTQAAAFTGKAESYARVTGADVACAQGTAGDFSCGSVDLLAFLPIQDIGGAPGIELNDVWGWTDPETRKDYALVGRVDGTSFVDISNPNQPVYVGQLELTPGAQPNSWRDIKVYKDHAYVVADGAGPHGVQVIDLTKLRKFAGTPIDFEADTVYTRVASAHNIVINEESGFAYAVGANSGGETCGGGLHMIDIREPKNPKFAGCFADTETGTQRTGYSHDAQCVMYHGPDSQYQGREICIGSNETAISIGDVTDKQNPKAISRASYPNVSYTHQGWFTDDHRYFYVNDEGDEVSGVVPRTRTLVWDLADLDDPQLVKEYLGETSASDHNLYIRGNLIYEANYASGLRIIDISDPLNPREVGFFDTQPVGENVPGFTGAWSNYPFFESGVIAVSSIEQGLFLVRYKPTRPVS